MRRPTFDLGEWALVLVALTCAAVLVDVALGWIHLEARDLQTQVLEAEVIDVRQRLEVLRHLACPGLHVTPAWDAGQGRIARIVTCPIEP